MDAHDSKTLESISDELQRQSAALAAIHLALDKIVQALATPAVPPDLQWVDVDGARRILSMERRQFVERIAPRPDFPKAARIDGVGRQRWRASEVSKWMDRQRGES